jgi:hypothetical protein
MGPKEFEMQNSKCKIEEGTDGSVRFGPHKSAWDRLGPDKIFSPRKTGKKIGLANCGAGREEHHRLWHVALCRFVPLGKKVRPPPQKLPPAFGRFRLHPVSAGQAGAASPQGLLAGEWVSELTRRWLARFSAVKNGRPPS